jgi:spore maturation protein SpmB
VGPVLRHVFPSVPRDHPAMSAMIMNISCNMLGLGNAATPFGIKAITELDTLNGQKGTATDAMVVFLAINTSGLAILPSTVISLRASLGSADPAGIFFTTWFASGCATVAGVAAALILARLPAFAKTAPPEIQPAEETVPEPESGSVPRAGAWRRGVALGSAIAMATALGLYVAHPPVPTSAGELARAVLSYWILPGLIGSVVLYAWMRGVKVYDSVVEGAKEGFQVAVRIIPYLVAVLVMVGMLRAAGGMGAVVGLLDPLTGRLGLPAEALPMALLRPFSGSGAYAIAAEIMQAHGPDTRIGYMVSTIQGSTETTFYVLAVYFGAVGVKRTRHAVPACVLADVAGISAAVFIVNLLYG